MFHDQMTFAVVKFSSGLLKILDYKLLGPPALFEGELRRTTWLGGRKHRVTLLFKGDGDQTSKKKKNYPKKPAFCPFCSQWQSHFSRHLERLHPTNPEVEILETMDKKKRQQWIRALRYRGAKLYNTSKQSNDPLYVARGSGEEGRRVICPQCAIPLRGGSLKKHINKCPEKPNLSQSINQSKQSKVMQIAKKQLTELTGMVSNKNTTIPTTSNPSPALIEFVSAMRNDNLSSVILGDPLLTDFGNLLCSSMATEGSESGALIRRKLSCLADLFLRMKAMDSTIEQVRDILDTLRWPSFIQAIKEKAGFDLDEQRFRAPTLVRLIGIDISGLAQHAISYALIKQDDNLRKAVENWLIVKKDRFHLEVGKSAAIDYKKKKWESKKLLPLTEDIKILDEYIKNKIKECLQELQQDFSFHHWSQLNEAVIVQIVLFNRKRVGDVEKCTIVDFNNRHAIQEGTEVYNSLNPYERTQAHKFVRMEAQGKGARGVAILLTHEQVSVILCILTWRVAASVGESNKYLFAKGEKEFFRGSTAMHHVIFNCGASNPATLTGTHLRKHMASTVQALNMSDNELSLLAEFMGHTDKTHRQFYRLPSDVAHLTVVASLLSVVNSGNVPQFRGRSIGEIGQECLNVDKPDDLVSLLLPTPQPPSAFNDPEPSSSTTLELPNSPQNLPMPTAFQTSQPPAAYYEDPGPSTNLPNSPPELPLLPTNISPYSSESSDSEDYDDEETRGKSIYRRAWSTPEKRLLREAFPQAARTPYKMPSRKALSVLRKEKALQRTNEQIAAWYYNERNRREREKAARSKRKKKNE